MEKIHVPLEVSTYSPRDDSRHCLGSQVFHIYTNGLSPIIRLGTWFFFAEYVQSLHILQPSALYSTLQKIALDLHSLIYWRINWLVEFLVENSCIINFKCLILSIFLKLGEKLTPIKSEVHDQVSYWPHFQFLRAHYNKSDQIPQDYWTDK